MVPIRIAARVSTNEQKSRQNTVGGTGGALPTEPHMSVISNSARACHRAGPKNKNVHATGLGNRQRGRLCPQQTPRLRVSAGLNHSRMNTMFLFGVRNPTWPATMVRVLISHPPHWRGENVSARIRAECADSVGDQHPTQPLPCCRLLQHREALGWRSGGGRRQRQLRGRDVDGDNLVGIGAKVMGAVVAGG